MCWSIPQEGYDAFFQRSCLQKQEVLKSLQEILIYVYGSKQY